MFEKRFTMRDDGDGLWSVVDAENGGPAVVQRRTLAALGETEARDAAALLNMVAGIRSQEPKPPPTVQPGLQPFLLPIR